jgi:hypothetical protein
MALATLDTPEAGTKLLDASRLCMKSNGAGISAWYSKISFFTQEYSASSFCDLGSTKPVS